MGLPKKVFWDVYFGYAPPEEWISEGAQARLQAAAAKSERDRE